VFSKHSAGCTLAASKLQESIALLCIHVTAEQKYVGIVECVFRNWQYAAIGA
jgi:hypothetical protein